MQSSSTYVKAVKTRKSRGVLQAVALLGLSTVGAITFLNHHTTPSSTAAAGTSGAGTTSTTTTNASGSTTTSGSTGTKSATGDAINYVFGTVQLKVTQSNGKITAIDLVQAGATNGRDQAFSYLVSDAIAANGTNFSNLSGATYTTDAFKQALSSAVSKL